MLLYIVNMIPILKWCSGMRVVIAAHGRGSRATSRMVIHLQGTIQANNTLFNLRHLQSLNLAFNDFNFSRISPDFGSFASLTHLNLSDTNFTGRIPSKISHLSKLISLDLCYNELGRLEQHTSNMLFRNLTQLRELHLDLLNISSPLPHALLNLSSLTSLSLGSCQLRGKFLENIFHFPNL
ncbi:hypothetical protein ACSBR1_023065 [Camellia fascicularis]